MNAPVVWVVSPHSSARQMIGLNLSKRGYRIVEASSLVDLKIPSGEPDLIVVDVEPPDESGWEVVRALRQNGSSQGVPLILLLATPPTISRIHSFHPGRWMKKPVDTDALLALVRESLPQQDRTTKMSGSGPTLADRVRAIPGSEHLYMCYSCGTCVGTCMIRLTGEHSYSPRRLIQKVINGLEQETFEDRTTWLCSACDLCYPACPQKIHVSQVLNAIKSLAVESGYTSPLQTAQVNEHTCVACGLCEQVCPYEAISLVEKQRAHQTYTFASVDAARCMACGLCVASCRSASIELPDEFSNEALVEDLWGWIHETPPAAMSLEEGVEWPETISTATPR